MIFEYIEPIYFFIAFFIGMLITYVTAPIPKVIIKYPTPENAGKIIYRDNADVCYKYKAKEVNCPLDKSKIRDIELQYVDNDAKNKRNIIDILRRKFIT